MDAALPRELRRRFDIDARERAIPADISIDDGPDARLLHTLRERDDIDISRDAPAIHRDDAVLRVDADDDAIAVFRAGRSHELRVAHGHGAENHAAHAEREHFIDVLERADAAAEFHGDRHRREDFPHGREIF